MLYCFCWFELGAQEQRLDYQIDRVNISRNGIYELYLNTIYYIDFQMIIYLALQCAHDDKWNK